MDVAAGLIAVLLLLAALGSCFPQLSPPVARDPERLGEWDALVRARYGGLADALAAGGAFGWFRSPGFLAGLALLAAATLACTLNRWRGLWRRAFHRPVRCSDAALESGPHTARLEASPEVDLAGAVRACLEGRGFRVGTAEAVTTNGRLLYLRGDRNRLGALGTLVTHLGVLLLVLGAALSGAAGWREEITAGPGATAEIGHGTGLVVRNEGFALERYADGSVAGYEAQVTLLAADQAVARGPVRVNEPLNYRGVQLLLQAYAETPDGISVTLLAVRDPGYGPVVVAGFLLLLGTTATLNFPHSWVHARIEPEGTVRLAGRAGRRAHGFGREFAALVNEIRQAVEIPQEEQP
jgi:cytochrome c biogenesis protein